jgi:hypothetical protein
LLIKVELTEKKWCWTAKPILRIAKKVIDEKNLNWRLASQDIDFADQVANCDKVILFEITIKKLCLTNKLFVLHDRAIFRVARLKVEHI